MTEIVLPRNAAYAWQLGMPLERFHPLKSLKWNRMVRPHKVKVVRVVLLPQFHSKVLFAHLPHYRVHRERHQRNQFRTCWLFSFLFLFQLSGRRLWYTDTRFEWKGNYLLLFNLLWSRSNHYSVASVVLALLFQLYLLLKISIEKLLLLQIEVLKWVVAPYFV